MTKITPPGDSDHRATAKKQRSFIHRPSQSFDLIAHLTTQYHAIRQSFLAQPGRCRLGGLSAINPSASEAATDAAGTLLGRYTLKSQLTNQYVRAGIGSGAYVGAKSDRVGGNTSWKRVYAWATAMA